MSIRRTGLKAMVMQMTVTGTVDIVPHNETFRQSRCFVGRSSDNTVSIYLPLRNDAGEYTVYWSKGDLEMDNEVVHEENEDIPCRVFRLFDKEKSDNFFDLVTGLASLLEDEDIPFNEMNSIVTSALTKWHGLFAEQSALSLIGLYGELIILDTLRQQVGPDRAIKTWHGPWKSIPQDFSSTNLGVRLEVKAKLGGKNSVSISSGYQLDMMDGQKLLLAVVRGEVRTLPSGRIPTASIPQLVDSMLQGAESFATNVRFEDGCRREGYIVGGTSNTLLRKEISLNRIDFYDASILPRLIPSTIPTMPPGIDPATVQYEIDLGFNSPLYSIDVPALGLSGLKFSPIGGYLKEMGDS